MTLPFRSAAAAELRNTARRLFDDADALYRAADDLLAQCTAMKRQAEELERAERDRQQTEQVAGVPVRIARVA